MELNHFISWLKESEEVPTNVISEVVAITGKGVYTPNAINKRIRRWVKAGNDVSVPDVVDEAIGVAIGEIVYPSGYENDDLMYVGRAGRHLYFISYENTIITMLESVFMRRMRKDVAVEPVSTSSYWNVNHIEDMMSDALDAEDDDDDDDDDEPLQALITEHVLVVVRDGSPQSIDKTNRNFNRILQAIRAEDKEEVYRLMDFKGTIEEILLSHVRVDEEGRVFIRGKETHNKLAQKVKELLYSGDVGAIDKLAQFQNKLALNTSFSIGKYLYEFISHSCIDIDDDGDILAYKVVGPDYLDLYSKTMDNSPGKTLQVDRSEVDDDMTNECSYGLHACASGYLQSYGNGINGKDRIVKVKINPADVVACPKDYSHMKLRTCRYEVLEDVTEQVRERFKVSANY